MEIKWSRNSPPELSGQLEAYGQAIVSNLDAVGKAFSAQDLLDRLNTTMAEYDKGTIDNLHLFLNIKALEYHVIGGLAFSPGQLDWFVRRDLAQTPATSAEVSDLVARFIGDCKDTNAVKPEIPPRLLHVAIGFWQQYAETLAKGVKRAKQLTAVLALMMASYIILISATGLLELVERGGKEFGRWLVHTTSFSHLLLGIIGAVVSLSLADSAPRPNRPFDDVFQFWSSIPRLFIGGFGGILAPVFLGAVTSLMTDGAKLQNNEFLVRWFVSRPASPIVYSLTKL